MFFFYVSPHLTDLSFGRIIFFLGQKPIWTPQRPPDDKIMGPAESWPPRSRMAGKYVKEAKLSFCASGFSWRWWVGEDGRPDFWGLRPVCRWVVVGARPLRAPEGFGRLTEPSWERRRRVGVGREASTTGRLRRAQPSATKAQSHYPHKPRHNPIIPTNLGTIPISPQNKAHSN